MKSVMFNLEFEVDFQILVFDVDVHFVFQKKSNTLFNFPLTYTMSSLSSLVATAQASVLQCEATLKAVETALGQAREDLSRVRTALDMTLSTLSPRDVWRPETPGPQSQPPYDDWASLWDEGKYPFLGATAGPSSSAESEDSGAGHLGPVRSHSKLLPFSPSSGAVENGPEILDEAPEDGSDASWATVCRTAADEDPNLSQCPKCGQPRSLCRDGESLQLLDRQMVGRTIQASGPTWSVAHQGRLAKVVAVCKKKINISLCWEDSSKLESFTAFANKVPKFSFFCPGSERSSSLAVKESDLAGADCLVRLPVKPFIPEVWTHSHQGEKHRLLVSSDQDINLVALGLMVERPITKIILSICRKNNYQDEPKPFFNQTFSQVPSYAEDTTVLKLQRKVPLAGTAPLLLVLNIFGGSSRVGCGGQQTVRGLRCEDYWHQDEGSRKTRVEKGLIEKFYVE